MNQAPPGWYPDPAPSPPGAPQAQRWWDGAQWTEHVQPLPPEYAAAPAYAAKPPALTPDGQPLAGWWHRLGAWLLDWVVVTLVSMALGFSFVREIGAVYLDYLDAVLAAAESGGQPPPQAEVMTRIVGPSAALGLVTLVVGFVYHVSFLKALAATPGKLATGLRVRLRDAPGPLSWGTVLRRWLAQNLGGIVGAVPFVGSLGFLYTLLDHLWPLWDPHKQALHDKFAATNVVRRPRS